MLSTVVADEQDFDDFMEEVIKSNNIQISFGRTSVLKRSSIRSCNSSNIVSFMKCYPLFLV